MEDHCKLYIRRFKENLDSFRYLKKFVAELYVNFPAQSFSTWQRSMLLYHGVIMRQLSSNVHNIFVKVMIHALYHYEFCYSVLGVFRRYLSFSLISVINFYYIINKLIILVAKSH
jgi:hypothetical protein